MREPRTTGDENGKRESGEITASSEAGISVVQRNTEEVQSRGNFDLFEELFAADLAPTLNGWKKD
jgi:hypothetical protein